MDIDLDRARALRVLGRGAMGTVFLVEARYGGFRYALKVFDKRSAAATRHDAERRARWELSVLSRLAHPHLPCLLGSAETPGLLAWAVPYCPGGDLNELRYALPDRVFSPAAIRFYVAEIVSALCELHASGVAYRDLKPENVLLRADGHVTLTDFDLSRLLPPKTAAPSSASPPPRMFQGGGHRPRVSARSEIPLFSHATKPDPSPPAANPSAKQQLQSLVRFIMKGDRSELSKKAKSARVSPVSRKPASFASSWGKSFSFVGTEEYVAPEMVRGEGHGLAVDWWAVGVLAYEMAYGRTPFKGKNRKETFRNVLLKDVEFAGDSRRRLPELTDLISRLLERDPMKRLGYQGGADEVRAHPFFAGVAWDMLDVVSRPPYIPPPADDGDEVVGDGEDFSIREYFDKLHQPPPPESESSSSEFSSEF
uniref:non-specific serine/threonine protein kinase n=1 Tax=Oryza glumipatula TaxID=40148 RepID=A0A0E0AXB8_9ORYZ